MGFNSGFKGLTLNSMAQIHTSVTLLKSRDLTWSSDRLTQHNNTAQYSTIIQHNNTAQYSTTQHNTALHSTTQHNTDH